MCHAKRRQHYRKIQRTFHTCAQQCDRSVLDHRHMPCFCLPLTTLLCRFFEDYKKNENKEVKVDEFLGADLAKKTITDSMVCKFLLADCPLSSLHFLILWAVIAQVRLFPRVSEFC